MSIPSEILNKEGRLTQEEYQIMKSHAKNSYDAIKERWDVTPNVKVAVLYHHENVDGSGYPTGITGDEMTLYTKIIHIPDQFYVRAPRTYVRRPRICVRRPRT